MDTVLLRTFLEVSKTRHFGKAAENLFITHSAVSFRIRQLEEIIGAKVFDRKRNNLSLTPAGERLINHAESILTSWQMALQDVGVSTEQSVQIGIGASTTIWGAYLSERLPNIAISQPKLALRTEVNSQVLLVRSVLEGQMDMALVFDPPKSIDLVYKRLSKLELALVSHQDNVSFERIPELDYIFVDWGMAFNIQHARLFDRSVVPILHTSQPSLALEYLLRKGGVAFLPQSLIQEQLETKQLFYVENAPEVTREIFAIHKEENDKAEVLELILQELEKG